MCLKLIFSVIYVRKFLGYYNASSGLIRLNIAIFAKLASTKVIKNVASIINSFFTLKCLILIPIFF
eukprot:TRINITY_DN1324_c0_g4_i1.p1 TRINITY_DN1324_c0_g4~~TRINITY_DN1324_c0_g4_i1.p1  ORF type:complete len:66 (-),score=1.93 TRINITY_DN1324_c0_g4_i1:10-207(-)